MNSSNQESPAQRTGAHRAHGRTPPAGPPGRPEGPRGPGGSGGSGGPGGTGGEQPSPPPPPFRHEPYLDGLFTYCLSVLCDHDAATDVLAEVLAVAERHPGRCPDEGDRRAWLYALARWGCLRRLAEHRRSRQGAHSARRTPERTEAERAPQEYRSAAGSGAGAGVGSGPGPGAGSGSGSGSLDVTAYRRTELARLAWPEAAGTTPAQREALELAVRHRLGVPELAAVLGTPPALARELLAGAACEVERTRAALAVVETGGCPSVSRLTGDGDGQVLLSTTLRAELVRHVDDCPRCRRVAERVDAAAPWPGTGGIDAALPLVPAPRTAVRAAMVRSGGRRGRRPGPRFDRTGFPMDPRDRAARRDRLRARAVTTTVVATVVAAPVIALWAAYRGAPETGEPVGSESTRISASESEIPALREDGRPLRAYENAGNTAHTTGEPGFGRGGADPDGSDVSVEVISTGAPAAPDDRPGNPGRLAVAASSHRGTTMLTLSAS
ncbi:RNA polymerase sigma factor, partial [Streptomyces vinaceus]|uniref:RNA polymerase sigma factor n=1 Tax=Streptomyces vinaceus TaxID=1960 RepID=UPI00369D0594